MTHAEPEHRPPPELEQPGAPLRPPAGSHTARSASAPDTRELTQEAPGSSDLNVSALSVRLERLRAFYGQAEAVRSVDLDFHANQVTAIIGPSGCGKSTLVRCINRMHEEIPGAMAEGRVLLEGLDVYDPSVDVVAVRRARRRRCCSPRLPR